jgi:hypothetical protein
MKLFYGYHRVSIVKIVKINYAVVQDPSFTIMSSYTTSEFANPKLEVRTIKVNHYHICPINVFGQFTVPLDFERKNKNLNPKKFVFDLTAEEIVEAIDQLRTTSQGFNPNEVYVQRDDGRIVDMTGRIVN